MHKTVHECRHIHRWTLLFDRSVCRFVYSLTLISTWDQHRGCFCNHSWAQAEWQKFESPNGYIPSCDILWHTACCDSLLAAPALCIGKCPFCGLFSACLRHFCALCTWLHCWKWPQAQGWRTSVHPEDNDALLLVKHSVVRVRAPWALPLLTGSIQSQPTPGNHTVSSCLQWPCQAWMLHSLSLYLLARTFFPTSVHQCSLSLRGGNMNDLFMTGS